MAPHLDVLDASEYPSDHTFFCSSQDTLPTAVSSVTESVHEDGAVAIHDLLLKLLERIAKRLGSTGTGQGAGAASDDEDDDEDDLDIEYDMDDDLMALGNDRTHKLQRAVLQRCAHFFLTEAYDSNYSVESSIRLSALDTTQASFHSESMISQSPSLCLPRISQRPFRCGPSWHGTNVSYLAPNTSLSSFPA